MTFLEALVYAVDELESLIASANSGVFDNNDDLERAKAAVDALNQIDYEGYGIVLLDPDGRIL